MDRPKAFLKQVRDTAVLRGFGLLRVPMITFLSPSVIELSDQRCEVKIPLTYRSKNHWGSMYFGALAVGCDTAIGLMAMDQIKRSNKSVSLIFKDFQAQFFKRADGHVHFICDKSSDIKETIDQALNSAERVNKTIDAYAIVPSVDPKERIAEFKLTLSLKRKN